MTRIVIRLTENQVRDLKAIAVSRGMSVSALVRESLDLYLGRDGRNPRQEDRIGRVRALAGKGSSGRSDISERHDDYLAEAFAE